MPSQCDLILEELQAAAGEWVPMPQLHRVSGSLNIHTRIDDLRHNRGIDVENKVERDPDHPRRNLSFYRIPLPNQNQNHN